MQALAIKPISATMSSLKSDIILTKLLSQVN